MARWFLGPMLLLLACCGGCYYHQMLPAMTICVRDQERRPVAGMRGSWSGYATEDEVPNTPFAFDPDGCARVARYNMWTTALNVVGALIKSISPHESGLRQTTSEVRVLLPEGYAVDEAASGLKRTDSTASGGGPVWEGRDDMDFYLYVGEAPYFIRDGEQVRTFPGAPKPPDEFVITLRKPGSRPAVQVRLILRRNAAQPARPGGAGG